MANNFSAIETTLTDATSTTIVSTTSNKQIVVGLNIANTGSSSIDVDVVLNDGSNNFTVVKDVSVPINTKVEIIKGKLVLGSGYSLTAQSSASGGDCDIIVSLLTDVA
jgi:hypothetical protein